VNAAAVLDRLRELRARRVHESSAWRLTALGVDVFQATVRFVGAGQLGLVSSDNSASECHFERAVILDSPSPSEFRSEVFGDIAVRLPAWLLEMPRLPRRVAMLGGGPDECELGQALRRLGSDVHLLVPEHSLLAGEEPWISKIVERQFEHEEIRLHLGVRVVRTDRTGDSKGLVVERGNARQKILVDEIFAANRCAVSDALDFAAAGIRVSPAGIEVDRHLRTTNRNVFAAGATSGIVTDAGDTNNGLAVLAIENATSARMRLRSIQDVPRRIHVDPQIVHLGTTFSNAGDRRALNSIRLPFERPPCPRLCDGVEPAALAYLDHGRMVGMTLVGLQSEDLRVDGPPAGLKSMLSRSRRNGMLSLLG
ncbi:MAG TPA: FAD-dependent oxidoreductase, partial [Pirellulales bacterium]|nr:FAD-dependent oxidoreductase [Pirellulales bacterium]